MAAQDAAATLQVGVTTLKKICRKYHILRWPYRKRFSQHKLIERVTRHISEAAQPTGAPDDGQARASPQDLSAIRISICVILQVGAPTCVPISKRYARRSSGSWPDPASLRLPAWQLAHRLQRPHAPRPEQGSRSTGRQSTPLISLSGQKLGWVPVGPAVHARPLLITRWQPGRALQGTCMRRRTASLARRPPRAGQRAVAMAAASARVHAPRPSAARATPARRRCAREVC